MIKQAKLNCPCTLLFLFWERKNPIGVSVKQVGRTPHPMLDNTTLHTRQEVLLQTATCAASPRTQQPLEQAQGPQIRYQTASNEYVSLIFLKAKLSTKTHMKNLIFFTNVP